MPYWRYLASLALGFGAAAIVVMHPYGPWWPLAAVAVYGAAFWRWPRYGLLLPLALLPALNFSPWTGWILIDEFDLMMLVTVALGLLRPGSGADHAYGPRERAAIALLAISFAASALSGFYPPAPFDHNALAGYYTNYNSLRVLKGFLWALLLLPLIGQEMALGASAHSRLATAMVAGLAVVSAVAIWQRVVFTGLFDFVKEYRITATFPEMHTGGGYAETYLATATPFIVLWIVQRPGAARMVAGAALFVAATYALAVTFARAGYAAYACGLLVMGVALTVHWRRNHGWAPGRTSAMAAFAGLAIAIAGPIATSSYMQSRVATVQKDLETRTHHWADALDMMDDNWSAQLLGMGLGSFPTVYLLKNPHAVLPGTYAYRDQDSNTFLRLGSGTPTYLNKRVATTAGQSSQLEIDLRSTTKGAQVQVYLCETGELYSFRCRTRRSRCRVPTESGKRTGRR